MKVVASQCESTRLNDVSVLFWAPKGASRLDLPFSR